MNIERSASGTDKLDGLSPSLAKAMIRSLIRGTTIASGVKFINVGHENWILAQNELLGEIGQDGHSDTKFVRGAYGAGKSHFLSVIQDEARENGWVTSHVECKVDGVQIDRFETLYPKIVSRMVLPDGVDQTGTEGNDNPLRLLLEKWAHELIRQVGVKDAVIARPFDAEVRLHARLEATLLRSNLSPDFIRAACVFARSLLARDFETSYTVGTWIGGHPDRISIPRHYLQKPSLNKDSGERVVLRPIGKSTAIDAMRGILWLVRSAGYVGLVLCIDEVEELAKLGSRKRQDQALQALREYVDHAGGDGGFKHFCMYLAATPEMFEGENYFPRYDALATRIQAVGPEINWRAPIIDLDRTPLNSSQLHQMALRIISIHGIAYGPTGKGDLPAEIAQQISNKVNETKFRIAKPRLLARVVVDFLERSRIEGVKPGSVDISRSINAAATTLMKEVSA
ncbi:DUF2791 family P-loop domain-containing protein [Bradyrhizobium sp. 168]|uniref:BREX system ATP-binding domain-containing protein n=1 Tax=Bradyrhizobium sp. 168 TaxID=2782639 RepID=UPI001FF874F9|nr:BREX system ATP-binding domain-containing protein [Bradyrhizobium sp. 168]MCK1580691.1 DUF2791 family P-loop domain-containing protein [Bradyrhizobium sp. 168]